MKPKPYLPAEDTEITREVEMLMQGYTMGPGPGAIAPGPEPTPPKRRTLDDMRRLSEHIKNVSVYVRK